MNIGCPGCACFPPTPYFSPYVANWNVMLCLNWMNCYVHKLQFAHKSQSETRVWSWFPIVVCRQILFCRNHNLPSLDEMAKYGLHVERKIAKMVSWGNGERNRITCSQITQSSFMLRPTKVFFLWCRNQFIEWQPSLLLCKGKEYHFLLMHKVPPPPNFRQWNSH